MKRGNKEGVREGQRGKWEREKEREEEGKRERERERKMGRERRREGKIKPSRTTKSRIDGLNAICGSNNNNRRVEKGGRGMNLIKKMDKFRNDTFFKLRM